MRFFRPGLTGSWLYPGAMFRMKTEEKLLCLTFDDGPDPGSTFLLLEILEKYNIKGIFFCDGRAAEKYPELVDLIISKGHITGNHGYLHLDGWKSSTKNYIEDISKASCFINSRLLRPPFGHLRIKQNILLKKKYKVVFWDVMPYDFDKGFGSENSLGILKKRIRSGSIIVLHDTPLSSSLKFLPAFLDFASAGGYRFVIPDFEETI
jgi:peptidoglycan-N-acetylglucosamine deacetylase